MTSGIRFHGWEVLNGVGVAGVGGFFFPLFLRSLSFFSVFPRLSLSEDKWKRLQLTVGNSLRPRLYRPRAKLPDMD